MPQLLVFGLVAAVGFYAFKKLLEELQKLDREDREKERLRAQNKKAPRTLKKDPKTGVYRLDDGNDD